MFKSVFNATCHSGPTESHRQILQQVFCCQTPGDGYKIALAEQGNIIRIKLLFKQII